MFFFFLLFRARCLQLRQIRDGTDMGAARFSTLVASVRAQLPDRTLTLFSGDAFAPSSLALAHMGKHMPPVLDRLGVDCAVFGFP